MDKRGHPRGRGGRGRAAPPSEAAGASASGPPPRRPGEGQSSGQSRGRGPGTSGGLPPQSGPAPTQHRAWGQPSVGRATEAPPRAVAGGDGLAPQVAKMDIRGAASGAASGSAAGDASGSLGRGNMRGKQRIHIDVRRTRPETAVTKTGHTGTPVNMQANYFRLVTQTDWCLYQYRVDFTPEEDRTRTRIQMMRDHRDALGAFMFDGTVLFTATRLPNDPMTFTSQRREDDAIINISCRLVGDIMAGNPQYVQFFNIMIRKFMGSLKLQMVKRDFYDANAKVVIDSLRMELWPGYLTSIRQHEHEMLMCAEVTHKVMRRETCYDLLQSCTRRDRNNYQDLFTREVVGTTVLTAYNNRTYRVDDVNFNINPMCTFERNGQQVTYCQYMKEKYNIQIQDTRQPMLVSKSKPREVRAGQPDIIYIIPEVCRCTGLTAEIRNDRRTMREIDGFTRLTPQNRTNALVKFIRRLTGTPEVQQQMAQWNMKMADQLITLKGRILPPETIAYGGNRSAKASEDWIKSLRSSPYAVSIPLEDWWVVFPNRMGREAEKFVSDLMQVGRGMNFMIREPRTLGIADDQPNTLARALNDILDRGRPQLILTIVTSNRPDRYSAIKKVCYVDRGVPSQVVTGKVITKGMSVATKVAIQIACKIGSVPWVVPNPAKGTMVVGFDVSHDSNRKELSYGAMVASTNDTFGSYFSTISEHKHGEELSNNLSVNIIKAVREWEKRNNSKPARIVIYRDGVGDGDIAYVHEHEVELIKAALTKFYGAPPKMAFIIVSKRINTRLFLNGNNPPPGAIIDDGITCPERYDFFLVSQHVTEGSVAPTSYNIIYDSIGWSADNLQRLSFKLCHMYFNWPGPVRVPAPCQYAHKLCFLVAQSLHRPTSEALETTLYYL